MGSRRETGRSLRQAEWDAVEHQAGTRLHIRMLGTFEVRAGDRVLIDDCWRPRKAAALLKLLALRPDHRIRRDLVIDLLWPNAAPGAGAKDLYNHVSILRRTLRGHREVVRLRDGIVELTCDAEVDVALLCLRAREALRSPTLAGCTQALALYTGDLLPHDDHEAWIESARASLHSLRRELVFALDDCSRAASNGRVRISILETLLAHDPTDEDVQRRLMRLLADAGRPTRALEQFEVFSRALSDEFGVEPTRETQDVAENIRTRLAGVE
jgi:DNA-binding SARP family transcriptional activator